MMGWPKGKPRKSAEPISTVIDEGSAVLIYATPEPMTREEVIARVMAEPPVVVANYEDIAPHCGLCRYWNPTGEMNHGQCRRFPAHPRNNSPYAHWPVMTATDWCGEFKAKD